MREFLKLIVVKREKRIWISPQKLEIGEHFCVRLVEFPLARSSYVFRAEIRKSLQKRAHSGPLFSD